MRIAILGAGAVACGSAALLMENCHDPALWSPSGAGTRSLEDGAPLVAEGKITGRFHPRIATECKAAMDGAEAVLVALPANGHRTVMEAMLPHLSSGQVVLVSAHAALAGPWLAERIARRGLDVPVGLFNTTVLRSRMQGPATVRINTLRSSIALAAVPDAAMDRVRRTAEALFGERFSDGGNALGVTLSNVNPQSHMALALCNFTRMEKGEAWGQSAHMTEAVSRLLEALDAERLAIGRALGLELRSMRAHYAATYGLPEGPLEETARHLAAQPGATLGPSTAETRYTLEDVPFGLTTLLALAEAAGTPAPLHRAGLDLFSALYGRDFLAENDFLPDLVADGTLSALIQDAVSANVPAS
ncbi:MAG: NAD/NADP octopine/nopaline dehydrogenase family protein [Salipiger thiooxidans]